MKICRPFKSSEMIFSDSLSLEECSILNRCEFSVRVISLNYSVQHPKHDFYPPTHFLHLRPSFHIVYEFHSEIEQNTQKEASIHAFL